MPSPVSGRLATWLIWPALRMHSGAVVTERSRYDAAPALEQLRFRTQLQQSPRATPPEGLMSERDSREGNTKLDTMANAAAAAMRAVRPQRCDL